MNYPDNFDQLDVYELCRLAESWFTEVSESLEVVANELLSDHRYYKREGLYDTYQALYNRIGVLVSVSSRTRNPARNTWTEYLNIVVGIDGTWNAKEIVLHAVATMEIDDSGKPQSFFWNFGDFGATHYFVRPLGGWELELKAFAAELVDQKRKAEEKKARQEVDAMRSLLRTGKA